jgi:drug/metabolite transporter (DMT)-like permease
MPAATRTGYLLCVLAALSWSATSPGLSYLIETYQVPALVLAFWRDAFIALACLIGLGAMHLVRRERLPRLSPAEWRNYGITGAISIGVYHALFVLSVALNGAALGIVLIYLYPAFVTIGARIFFKERLRMIQVAAILLAVAGSALLVRAYDPAVLRLNWVGILVGIASAATHAGYVLFNQRAVSRQSPWFSLTLTMSFGTLTLLVLALISGPPAALLAIGPGATPWLIIAALAVGPTLGGYILFTTALRHIPGQIASLIVVVEAPIATTTAILLLGEQIEPLQAVGMALVLTAAVLPGIPLGRWFALRRAGEVNSLP